MLHQAVEVDLELGVAPAGVLPHLAPGEAKGRCVDLLGLALGARPSRRRSSRKRRVCGGSSSSVLPRASDGQPVGHGDVRRASTST